MVAIPIDQVVLVLVMADTAAVPALAAGGLDLARPLIVLTAEHTRAPVLNAQINDKIFGKNKFLSEINNTKSTKFGQFHGYQFSSGIKNE